MYQNTPSGTSHQRVYNLNKQNAHKIRNMHLIPSIQAWYHQRSGMNMKSIGKLLLAPPHKTTIRSSLIFVHTIIFYFILDEEGYFGPPYMVNHSYFKILQKLSNIS